MIEAIDRPIELNEWKIVDSGRDEFGERKEADLERLSDLLNKLHLLALDDYQMVEKMLEATESIMVWIRPIIQKRIMT